MISEFDTTEQESSYTVWLRGKIASSLADDRAPVPHDEVERRMANRFDQMRQKQRKS